MTPSAKYLWDSIPIGKWVSRNKARVYFSGLRRDRADFKGNLQRAISTLYADGLIELEFRDEDERGLKVAEKLQFIRRKPIQEIQADYNNYTSPRSKEFEKKIFKKLMVQCNIKEIKYRPWFMGNPKRKSDAHLRGGDPDW